MGHQAMRAASVKDRNKCFRFSIFLRHKVRLILASLCVLVCMWSCTTVLSNTPIPRGMLGTIILNDVVYIVASLVFIPVEF